MKRLLFLLFLLPSFAEAATQDVCQSSQLEVNVTLYPHDVALIKEKRRSFLKAGYTKLLIKDIPALILMDTFLFKVLPPSPSVDMLEYTFRSSHLTREELLKHSIGEPILLLARDLNGPPRPAQLLSLDGEEAIISSAGVIFSVKKDLVGFPNLPYTLVAEPIVTLKIKAEKEGESLFEMGYLTQGFSWKAAYTIIVDTAQQHLDLNNWITLHNKSGVNIKKGRFHIANTLATSEKLYELEHPITLADQETKNISWFSVENLAPTKNFCIFPKNNLLLEEQGVIMKPPVETWLSVQNTARKGLGIPLPEGEIKVFKRNEDGSLFYVGTNKTAAIPLNHSLSLRLGTTNDISAEVRQTDYRKLGSQAIESGHRLDLKNMTDTPRKVLVFQNISDKGAILRETHPHEQEDAHIRWTIPLAPHESVSLRYRIRLNLQQES
jgi:hypothetical protein